MPYVVNGVGTWNYGKERVHRIKATCEFCHSLAELTSYDTTLYFVVVFVPLIPLRKNRILNDCPNCRKHRMMKVKDWDAAKTQSMNETLAKLAEKPDDNEVLGEALMTATYFQDEALFDRIADLAKSETEDAKLQHLLGETYGYFSRRSEAAEAFGHALRINPTPEVQRSAAMNALRMGDPQQAADLLKFVTRDRDADSLPFLQAVIEGMQSQGMHEEALALMDERDAAFPDIATDKQLLKARKQSEKYRSTGKKLKLTNLIETNRGGTSDGSPRTSRLLKFTLPILLILGLIAFCGYSFWLGGHQPVYLVNGTTMPYTVQVAGTEQELQPCQPKKVRVPEGDLIVESTGFEPVSVTIQHSFWSRPFDSQVLILNPDRVAVVEDESATYSAQPVPDNSVPNFQIGKSSYSMKTPDYLFEPLPAQISIKGSGTRTKTRIGITPGLMPTEYLSLALREPELADRAATLKALCEAFPDQPSFLQWTTTMLPPADMLAFLKPGLAVRPLRMEWHRTYQSLMERALPDVDLLPDYQRLDSELSSNDSKYLLARILPDPAVSLAMIRAAATATPPSAYAQYSLAFHALAQADYAKAVLYSRQACEAKPDNLSFEHFYAEALWAHGDYDTYLSLVSRRPNQGLYPSHAAVLMRIGVAKNDNDMIQTARDLAANDSLHDPHATIRLSLAEALARGDAAAYRRHMAQQPSEQHSLGSAVILALLENEIDAAATLCESPQLASSFALTSLALRKAGQVKRADALMEDYAQYLAQQGRDERKLAAMLEGKQPLDMKMALNAIMSTEEKRLMLLMLAAKYPDHATELNSLSRKLDVQRDDVSLVLKQLSK